MARADAKTAVLADGLRYKSKVSGSPFAATTSFGAATMSCFMCGKHRARSLMGTRKVLGKSQAVCAPSCKALDEILEKAAAAAAVAAAATLAANAAAVAVQAETSTNTKTGTSTDAKADPKDHPAAKASRSAAKDK